MGKKKNKIKEQQTFILFWNPEISNFKDEDLSDLVKSIRQRLEYEISWSIWDWQKANKGDRFFFIRCGMPNPEENGVFASGVFVSKPYVKEDGSDGGRKEHYVDLSFDKIIDCNFCPVLSSVLIEKKIYDFDWHGGYSGRWLDVYRSYDLISLWSHHAYKISNDPKMSKKVYCPVLKC